MSYKPKVLEIAAGGTNSSAMSTSTGLVKFDGTSLVTSSTLTLDANNQMQNTAQPAFFAKLSSDLTDVTGDGTQYNVVWDTETVDQNSDFNTTTGTFVAPVTGMYMFTAVITIDQIGAGHTTGIWRFIATGFQYRGCSINPFVSAPGTAISETISGVFKMTAGHTMQTQIIVTGSTKTIDVLWGSSSSVLSFFSGFLIC